MGGSLVNELLIANLFTLLGYGDFCHKVQPKTENMM